MRKQAPPIKRRTFEQSTSAPRLANSEPLLTPTDVARLLNVSRGLIYALMHSGDLPSIAIGRVRRIRAHDLDQFMKDAWKGGTDSPTDKPAAQSVQGRLAKWRSEHGHV